jgi:transposase
VANALPLETPVAADHGRAARSGTAENVVAIENQGIRADVPLSEAGRRPGLFADTDFAYNAEDDTYRCPGEQPLRFLSQCETTRRRVYEAPASACRACDLKARCTTSQRGRRVGRGFDEDYLDRVRGDHATEPYAKAMRKRKVWVEPLFAEAKEWHGLRRFRLRGLPKVNSEALLIAAGQNLKRLLSRCGWGRRPWPNGAAGLALPAPAPAPAACG